MSYTRLFYHIVFRTKYSIPSIDIAYEDELYRYIWGIVQNKEGVLFRIGGMPDHLHPFVELTGKQSIADFVREVKASSSKWLKSNPHFPLFSGWGKDMLPFHIASKTRRKSSIT